MYLAHLRNLFVSLYDAIKISYCVVSNVELLVKNEVKKIWTEAVVV
jgi:hypothetical protein